ncbi:MAG: cation diffusion facilitator family transporter [Thermoanaerobaculia bacterium]|nr:cation diffusion facilitator family transporter [Thermoanaerobaculia bacterium]
MPERPHTVAPLKYAWIAIAAAVATIAIKSTAYLLTGSVGLLSDALESLVNLAGAVMALAMLTVAGRPEDEDHAYGHGKAEYFSSGFEGGLIAIAALGIAAAAIDRLITPRELHQLGIGLAVSFSAALVNLGAALVLLSASKKHRSVTLEASGHHLLTDVWTSLGVLAGVGLVFISGKVWLDPIVALVFAANIFVTGWRIVTESVRGLMDASLPAEEIARIKSVLARFETDEVRYHALRTRRAGTLRFVTMHVLVPGAWSVKQGHDLVDTIERELHEALPSLSIIIHIEPIEDPAAWADQGL